MANYRGFNNSNNLMPKREPKQYLNVRIKPSRRASVVNIAVQEGKTLTQVIEEAIDIYLISKGQ